MNRNEAEMLMAASLAGELDDVGERKLESFLAENPDALRELAAQRSMDAALRVLLNADGSEKQVIESVTSVLRAKSCEEFQSDFMREIRGGVRSPRFSVSGRAKHPEGWTTSRVRRSSRTKWVAFAACIAVLIAAAAFLSVPRDTSAFIVSASPSTFIERGAAKLPARAGVKLRFADSVRTAEGQSVQIVYQGESTRLELKENSELRFVKSRRGKRLNLLRGEVTASVDKQPAKKPMVFLSPQAEAEIVGTKFTLTAKRHSTWLEVTEGVVNLRRLSDQATARVEAGQFAVAAKGVELVSRAANGGIAPASSLSVKLQLFSEYKNDNLWRVSREAIQQTQVATALRSFQFPPMEGSYCVEALVTVDHAGPVSDEDYWGFGVGLARFVASREKLEPRYLLHVAQRRNLQAKAEFSSDWPPRGVEGVPLSLATGIAYRVKVQAEAFENGKTRLRGKVWRADAEEPEGWTADTALLNLNQPFDQVILTTSSAAATFKDLKVSFIE